MSRFYKTTTPDFVDDYMYQPPWELMEKAMEVNEEGIQKALASTSLFNNLEIQHLDDPIVNAKVEELRNKYTGTADDITSNIQSEIAINPQAWKKYVPEISNLQSEFQKDYLTGDIAKLQRDYAGRVNFEETNKDIKEKNPNFYYSALNAIHEDWASDPNREADWVGERLSDFDINSKEIVDGLKDFQAKVETQIQNGYITETKYKDPNAIVQDYMTTVFNDPKAQQFLQQAYKYKIPGFVDAEGNPISPEIAINKETKQPVSTEEYNKEIELYQNLSEEEKVEQGRDKFKYERVLNPEFAWTSTFQNMGNRLGGVISRTVKADPVQAARENRAWEAQKMTVQHQMNKEIIAIQANAVEIADKNKKQKENNAEIADLEEERAKVKEGSPRYKVLTNQINQIKDNNLSISQEVQSDFVYDDVQRIITNPEIDPTSPLGLSARNIDNISTKEATKKVLNIKEGEGGNLLYADKDPKISKNKKIIAETFEALGPQLQDISLNRKSWGNWSKKGNQQDELIINYITENFDIKKEDLRRKGWKGPQKATLNTPLYDSILEGLYNILDEKKNYFKNYNRLGRTDAMYSITEEMQDHLSNYYLGNANSYSVRRTNLEGKSRIPTTEELLKNGTIKGVTNQSPWGVSPIIDYKDETYYLAGTKGNFVTTSKDRSLFDQPVGYVRPEDYQIMSNFLKSNYKNTIISQIAEAVQYANSDLIVTDYNNKSKKGEPLHYTETSIFLGDKGMGKLRVYIDSDRGYNYTLLDENNEMLYNFINPAEIAPVIDKYVDYKEEAIEEIELEEFNP